MQCQENQRLKAFAIKSGVELGKVVAAAASLPEGELPEVGVKAGGKRAFCYATTRAWRSDTDFPLDAYKSLMSREAAGFLGAHDIMCAQRALTEIIRQKGKSYEDFGIEMWELSLADTYENIVKSGKLCSEGEWADMLEQKRQGCPAGLTLTLAIEELEDGTMRASAGIRLDSIVFGHQAMNRIEAEVKTAGDVQSLARRAVAEAFPWVLRPEATQMIDDRPDEPIRKAIEERKDGEDFLPDIPRWINETANEFLKEIKGRQEEEAEKAPEKGPDKPRKPQAMRM